ncbi:TetR family transcriptional regulator [Microbacterium sp. X-17]|uniref:TetR family transcriptional regulator n=1 Tax=Microbacterium sp. X-17 TaxID=3144404 RepID=UPI0031F48DEF
MSTPSSKRSRRSRGSIDAEMILRGAFELAYRDGLDAMTMQGLATQLNVGVTSIYWYVRSKDDLLQRMHESVGLGLHSRLCKYEDFGTSDWRRYLLEFFRQLRREYADDDVLSELMLGRKVDAGDLVTRASMQRQEGELGFLVDAGFTPLAAWELHSTLWLYTSQVASLERTRRSTGIPPEGVAQLSMLDQSTMPLLALLVTEHGVSLDGTGEAFIAGLNLILDAAEMRHRTLARH